MVRENIYNGIGLEIGYITEDEIFFHDQKVGHRVDQEFYGVEGWYLGKWMGKNTLGKIFDVGMERHGYMIATTHENDHMTPIDVGKYLVRNRDLLLLGTADSAQAGAALALFYFRENVPLHHPDFKLKKTHILDYKIDAISVDATQEFLANRQESLINEMIHQRKVFTGWLEFFLSQLHDRTLIMTIRNYEAKMGLILELITLQFVKSQITCPNFITKQMLRFLSSSFYFMASWENVREALNQRLILKFNNYHRMADSIIRECNSVFFQQALDKGIRLLDKTRTDIFSAFYMDYGEEIGINYASSPLAIMGIPFEEMDTPWNWMNIGFELGLEVYHNVKGLKDELKYSLFEFLFGNFQQEVKVHWFPWRHYLFADIFSILMYGPSMVEYFADTHFQEMLDLQIEFNREKNIWEQEPLEYVRFMVQCTLLRRLGFGTIARKLEGKITPIAVNPDNIIVDGTEIEMRRFLDPAKQMISLILSSKLKSFNGSHLTNFINFTPIDQKKVLNIKEDILNDSIDMNALWRFIIPAAYLALNEGKPAKDLVRLMKQRNGE